MCGRFAQYTPRKRLAEVFEVRAQLDLPATPRYNISPTQTVTAIRPAYDGEREFAPLRWGLIPRWARDKEIGGKTFNARAETVSEKPSFREPFKRRRCLIPVDGFFEWQRREDKKQPHYFYMSEGQPFAFAGLWDSWTGSTGEEVESCTILTTTPNELLSPYHDTTGCLSSSRRKISACGLIET